MSDTGPKDPLVLFVGFSCVVFWGWGLGVGVGVHKCKCCPSHGMSAPPVSISMLNCRIYFTTFINFSMNYLVIFKVYNGVCGINCYTMVIHLYERKSSCQISWIISTFRQTNLDLRSPFS